MCWESRERAMEPHRGSVADALRALAPVLSKPYASGMLFLNAILRIIRRDE